MPKLLSRSKHEEFELNLALQIRNRKERRAENAWKLEPAGNLAGLRNFTGCKISQLVNFRKLRNFFHAATVHLAALFMSPALFTILLFVVLTPFCHFLVFFLFCPHCNSICYVILVICKGGLAIKAPKTSTVDISFLNKISFWREAFNSPASFSSASFSLIFFYFLGYQTPL